MINITQNGNIIDIEGNIKSIEDFEKIKNELDKVEKSYDSVVLNIKDSISITSSVIGYLMKLNDKGKKIYINVASEDLYGLLDDLNLKNIFSVKRI